MKDIIELIIEIAEGNPGAITVIKKLEWYSKWFEMIQYMKKIGLTGSKIWISYKDTFHQDIDKFANYLRQGMAKDMEFSHFNEQEKNMKYPKFTGKYK